MTSRDGRGHALIVGAGPGLGAALARRFAAGGLSVSVAARDPGRLSALCQEIGARSYVCDAAEPGSVDDLFGDAESDTGPVTACIFNASARVRGPIADLEPAEVSTSLSVTALGGFLVGRRAARSMLATGHGTILFTGASASVKGYSQSAPFAMGKFALRGLAQSMARELAPKNIHVAHVVIDGGIRSERRPADPDHPDALLDADAIARTYWNLHCQERSAWSWEIELRPWVEPF